MKGAVLGTVLLLAVVACSNERGETETSTEIPPPDGMARCDEVFVDDATIDSSTFSNACVTSDDRMVVPRPARFECTDDRVLVWNDFAWGYVGEPMTLFEENDDRRMPVEQADECLGTNPAESPVAPTSTAG